MTCSSNRLKAQMESQNAADRLDQLTQDLFGDLEPELLEEWRKVQQTPLAATVEAQPLTTKPTLETGNAKHVAVKKWEARQEPSVASTKRKRRWQRKPDTPMQPPSKKRRTKAKSGLTQSRSVHLEQPVSSPTAPVAPTVTATPIAATPIAATSMTSAQPQVIETNTKVLVTNPLTFLQEVFDTDIAPNLAAECTYQKALKQCIYRKMFLLHVSNNLSTHTSSIDCNDLYLIALSALQNLGLVPL